MSITGIPPSPPFSKGGEPLRIGEGFLPFLKGGQEGFSDLRRAATIEIPPSPPFAKGGEHPAYLEGFLPLEKGGQEGFNLSRSTPCA